jgi:phospholipase/carboxylesterase
MSATRPMLHSELIPAEQKDSRRLLVALHGLGDSMEGYRWLPEAMNLPWLNYLLVNAPEEYYGGYSWYDYAGDITPGVTQSVRMVSELLEAQRKSGWPTEQTILGGFSQGCLISIETGLRYAHKLAGIVGISGYVCDPRKLVEELSPVARDIPILVTHGTFDPVIPIEQSRPQMEFLRKAGLNLEWREFAKPHTIAGELELSVIRSFIQGCLGIK